LIKSLKKGDILKGEDVFLLYDTYGFPMDLTELIIRERGYKIDVDGYNECMNVQKNKARGSQKFKDDSSFAEWTIISDVSANNFIGYKKTKIESEIVKYRQNEDKIEIVCKDTPFYAESGGQIGDVGRLTANNFDFKVKDVQKSGTDFIHIGQLMKGGMESVENIEARIDEYRRNAIMRNHTATHLLHKALKDVLGDHVEQAGSMVGDEILRFDLTHYEQIMHTQIIEIESLINNIILRNLKVGTEIKSIRDAQKDG
ncbi:uncharacterized protein METZ01_LOCUS450521, partial [marine metagenome]